MNPSEEDIILLGKLRDAGVWLRGETEDGQSFGGRIENFGYPPGLDKGFVCTIQNCPGMQIKLDTLGVQMPNLDVIPVIEWLIKYG